MTQTALPNVIENIKEMKIEQLTYLEEIGLSEEDLAVAKRETKDYHVTALSEVETKDLFLFPLLIGEYNGAYVLLGGYHRVKSRKERIERNHRLEGKPNADGLELKQLLTRKLTEQETQKIEDGFKQTIMAVTVVRYDNTFDMVLAAQEDNLKNPLGLDEKSRTQMAKWYYLKAEEAYSRNEIEKGPTYRKVADKYGIKGQTLWESIQKHKKSIEKAIEDAKKQDLTEGTEQAQKPQDEKPERAVVTNYVSKDVKKDATKLIKALETFIETIGDIQFDDTLNTQIVRDFNTALTEYNVSEKARGVENDSSLDTVDLERLAIWLLACTQVENQKMVVVKLKNALHPQPKQTVEKAQPNKSIVEKPQQKTKIAKEETKQ